MISDILANKQIVRVFALSVAALMTLSMVFTRNGDVFATASAHGGGDERARDSSDCPFAARDGRTIIQFNSRLRANKGIEGARPDWFDFIGQPGTYKISLATYDNHSDKGGQDQNREIWILKFENSAGEILIRTAAISDLPDHRDAISEVVEENIFIGPEIVMLTPLHAAYPSDSPESLTAVCAAFDLIELAPECADSNEDNDYDGAIGGNDKQCEAGNDDQESGASDDNSSDDSAGAEDNRGDATEEEEEVDNGGRDDGQNESEEDHTCDACGGEGGNGKPRGGGGPVDDPLNITNEQVVWAGQSIIVTWATNINSTSRVYFGTSSPKTLTLDPRTIGYATSSALIASTTKFHTVVIYDAAQDQTHYLRPSSQRSAQYDVRTLGRELRLGPMATSMVSTSSAPEVDNGTGTIDIITDCGRYLNSYIKYGAVNDFAQVMRLQKFLRDVEGFANTPQTGVYDSVTRELVNAFQQRYRSDVLEPWGLTVPTGYVYITTQKRINERYCQYLSQQKEFPLTPGQLAEITACRTALEQQRMEARMSTGQFETPQVGISSDAIISPDQTAYGIDATSTEADTTNITDISGIKDIDIKDIGTETTSTTSRGLLGRLGDAMGGGFSTPTFLGILSLLLLVIGAVILSRSLRESQSEPEVRLGQKVADISHGTTGDSASVSKVSDDGDLPIGLPTERHDSFLGQAEEARRNREAREHSRGSFRNQQRDRRGNRPS